ncbi:sigma-70 family RNA polymerase sigma factor [Cupriavidus plantarum]|uniref:sigma-70 family RNA polymerase sigma factor n=1 Tax=Cupriavidus plantarum TaxID=942865 RepID=UPI001B1260D1|nr:sigma-70 family RNA polymerase sigma factor [Cupriavidus plantarum]CAG2142716.1 hypothetical protein LMG26296_03269 [Cupriavidus plantarum]SMR65563.1 RNA polymerase sigma-70 factor, ECF subfamily [Cupriavidus plantarum]
MRLWSTPFNVSAASRTTMLSSRDGDDRHAAARHPDAPRATPLQPHADAAHNLARWLCGNARDADALAQASMRQAEAAIDGFHGERPRTWLLGLVHATWRAQQPPGTPQRDMLDPGMPSAGDPMLRLHEQDVHLVQAALERLPTAGRVAIVLRELEGLHYRDIAAITDTSREAVQATLSRARRQLAATIVLLRSSTP